MVFLVAFEFNVGGRENVQSRWASLQYGDTVRFFEIAFFLDSVVWGKSRMQK